MSNTAGTGTNKIVDAMLACGRSIEEQINAISTCGNQASPIVLRSALLAALGFPKPREKADVAVIFGCYNPFLKPDLLKDYLRLLDLLDVNYTYLDQEYCCGVPIVIQTTGEDRDKALEQSKKWNRLNSESASRKGADTLAYCCVGCGHALRSIYPEQSGKHIYIFDLIADKLKNKRMKMAPERIGYFEGCHSLYKVNYPGISLNWHKYREVLGKIEGLEIVDLPNNFCCKNSPEKIIENAQRSNLESIACSCNGCTIFLGPSANGKIQIRSIADLFMTALKG